MNMSCTNTSTTTASQISNQSSRRNSIDEENNDNYDIEVAEDLSDEDENLLKEVLRWNFSEN